MSECFIASCRQGSTSLLIQLDFRKFQNMPSSVVDVNEWDEGKGGVNSLGVMHD